MKFISSLLLCLLFAFAGVHLTGCAALAGVAKAEEAYKETQANVSKAKEDVEKVTKEIIDLRNQYAEAVKAGDKTKAETLMQLLVQAFAKFDVVNSAFESSKNAWQAAAKRLQDSQGAADYMGNIFGIVLGAVGGILGGGTGVGAMLGKQLSNLSSAVKKTASNVDTAVPEAGWDAFTKAQRDAMTPAERAIFDRAAGLKV